MCAYCLFYILRQCLRYFTQGLINKYPYVCIFTHTQIYICACMRSCLSHVRLFATPWTVVHQAHYPWDSPGKNTGVGCHGVGSISWDVLDPGIEPVSLVSPVLAGRFFTTSTTWKAYIYIYRHIHTHTLLFQIEKQISLKIGLLRKRSYPQWNLQHVPFLACPCENKSQSNLFLHKLLQHAWLGEGGAHTSITSHG